MINAFGGRWFDENWKPSSTSEKIAGGDQVLHRPGQELRRAERDHSRLHRVRNLFIQGKAACGTTPPRPPTSWPTPKQNPQAANIGFAYEPIKEIEQRLALGLGLRDGGQLEAPGRRARVHEVGHLEGLCQARRHAARLGPVPSGVRASTYDDAGYKDTRKAFADLVLTSSRRRTRPRLRRSGAVQGAAVRRRPGVRHPRRRGDARSSPTSSPATRAPTTRSRRSTTWPTRAQDNGYQK